MKSAFVVSGGYAMEAVLPVIRLMALAWLLPQDQFGVAIAALATLVIAEISCDIGIATSAVRGSATIPYTSFVATLHTLTLLRSAAMITLAVLLLTIQQLALDSPIGTDLFVLAVAIFGLRGFENFSLKQYSREYNFVPEAYLIGGGQVLWTIVSIMAAYATASYVAMFYGMLAAAAWQAVYSNLLAPLRWRVSWNGAAAREALRFGAPLVPNGMVSALANSDRYLIGAFLGAKPVAVYGVAMGLATLPRTLFYRVIISLLVPHFTNLVNDPERFRAFYMRWLLGAAVLAGSYSLALILLGQWAIGLAFGPAYTPSNLLIVLIAINVFIKFLMLVPVPAAYARGETGIVLLGSAISAMAVVPGAVMLSTGMGSLETFLLAMNIFEGVGLVFYFMRVARRHSFRRRTALLAAVAPLVLLGTCLTIM